MRKALAIPSLRALWLGQGISVFGNVFLQIAAFWILQLRSPYLLVAAGVVIALPQLLAFLGGVLVDHFGAWRLMVLTDVVRAAVVGTVLVVALTDPAITPYLLLVALALTTLGGALFSPAEGTLLPELASGEELVAANGLMQSTFQTASAVGAAMGGAALLTIGVGSILGFDAATFVISVVSLWFVTSSSRGRVAPTGARAISLSAIREGLAAAREMRWLIQTVPLIAISNLIGFAAFISLPYWVHHVLAGTVADYGLFDALFAGGIIVGALSAASLKRWPAWQVIAVVAFADGCLFLVFPLWRSIPAELAIFALAGVLNGVVNTIALSVIQASIPAAMRGRVLGMVATLLGLGTPFGPLLTGVFFAASWPLGLLWMATGVSSMLLGLVWGLSKDIRTAMADGFAGAAAAS